MVRTLTNKEFQNTDVELDSQRTNKMKQIYNKEGKKRVMSKHNFRRIWMIVENGGWEPEDVVLYNKEKGKDELDNTKRLGITDLKCRDKNSLTKSDTAGTNINDNTQKEV